MTNSNSGNGWLVSAVETKTIKVKSTNGAEGTVELRRMNEGDRQDRENEIMRSRQGKGRKGARESAVEYQIGALRRFDFKRLIVGWSLPFPLNDSTFRDLEPAVAEQIHEEIRKMNPFVFDEEGDDAGENPTSPATEAETTTD